jgi:Protein of unknown function (DUF1559)
MARFQLSLRGLMIAVAICGLLCWPLGLVIERVVHSRNEGRCSANLVEIGNALYQYESKYGHFPPAYVADATGKPAHSWRVLLLEFLEPTLFGAYDFKESWDGPNNSKLLARMPRVYACPNRLGRQKTRRSSYAVIVGAQSAFRGSGVVKIADITDRGLNIPTILVAEVESLDIRWMEPRDLRVDQLGSNDWTVVSQPGISSEDHHGAGLLCVGGRVRRLSPAPQGHYLRSMVTISGNESFTQCE